VVRSILEATIDILARSGYAALSFEDVASRAGVSRTTIYRRWPAKPDLVRAALLRLAEEYPAGRDTGSIRGDLLEMVGAKFNAETAERDAGLLRALMAEFDSPDLLAIARLVRNRIREPGIAAVERAVARGELPAGTDPLLVLDPVMATVNLKRCIFRDEMGPGFVEALVDTVLAGARSGAARLAGPRRRARRAVLPS
jgi:AcrR family transcriptional regulator